MLFIFYHVISDDYKNDWWLAVVDGLIAQSLLIVLLVDNSICMI